MLPILFSYYNNSDHKVEDKSGLSVDPNTPSNDVFYTHINIIRLVQQTYKTLHAQQNEA